MTVQTELGGDRHESVEDLRAQMRQVQEQAEEYRYQARLFDSRVQSAAQTLVQGWQGDRARRVVWELDEIRAATMRRFNAYANSLDERNDELQRAVLAAQDEDEARLRRSGRSDANRLPRGR